MASAYEEINIQDAGRNVYGNVADLRRMCKHVIANADNSALFDLDLQLHRTQTALQGHIDSSVGIDVIGAAMETVYRALVWSVEKPKFVNLQTVLIPSLIQDIGDNFATLTAAFVRGPKGGLKAAPMTGSVRNAIVARCTELLAATDLAGA